MWGLVKDFEKFPSTTLLLTFIDNDGNEVRWELGSRLGYKSKVKDLEIAMASAVGKSADIFKNKNTSLKGVVIGENFGGKHLIIETPAFKMSGDLVQVVSALCADGWWEPMSKEEIEARAAQGFIARPFKISVSDGKHQFQGAISFAEAQKLRAAAAASQAAGDTGELYEEDFPF